MKRPTWRSRAIPQTRRRRSWNWKTSPSSSSWPGWSPPSSGSRTRPLATGSCWPSVAAGSRGWSTLALSFGDDGYNDHQTGIALGWHVHNERRWSRASSFLPNNVSTKSVLNRGTEKPVLNEKIGMTPFATSNNTGYAVQKIAMNFLSSKRYRHFLLPNRAIEIEGLRC